MVELHASTDRLHPSWYRYREHLRSRYPTVWAKQLSRFFFQGQDLPVWLFSTLSENRSVVVAIAKGVRRLMYAAFPRVKRKWTVLWFQYNYSYRVGFCYMKLMHLSFASPGSVLGGIPSGTQGWYNFVIFFPVGKGSLVLETTSMDHGGILARFVRGRQGKKCFTWYPGRRVKMIKKNLQKMGYICLLFLPMKRKYYTLIWQ